MIQARRITLKIPGGSGSHPFDPASMMCKDTYNERVPAVSRPHLPSGQARLPRWVLRPRAIPSGLFGKVIPTVHIPTLISRHYPKSFAPGSDPDILQSFYETWQTMDRVHIPHRRIPSHGNIRSSFCIAGSRLFPRGH